MPLFSIIIPAYNVEKYIGETIDSLLQQTFDDFEVIIINDGSNDKTLETAESIINSNNKFRIYTTNNGGVSRARNLGISLAAGKFIYYLDGDDMLTPMALEVLAKEIGNTNPDAVLFNSNTYIDSTKKIDATLSENYHRLLGENHNADGKSILKTAKSKRPIVSPCMYVTKRDLITGLSFLPETLHEDNAYFAELFFERVSNVRIISDPLFIRRIRPASITTTAVSPKNIDGYVAGAVHLCSRLPTYTRGEQNEIMHSFIRDMLWDAIFLLQKLNMRTETGPVKRRILGTCATLYAMQGMTLRQLFSFARATLTSKAAA
jgi:glycosyltransferase involved in cell wall biosynthesis